MSEELRPEEEGEKVQASDLSELEGFSFGPSWAKAPPTNPYAGREDWSDDAAGGRDDRRGGGRGRRDRDARGGMRRERRGGEGPGGRREGDRRGPGGGERRRGDAPRGAGAAGPRPAGAEPRDGARRPGGPRGPRRDGGDRERRPPRERMNVNISFLPDRERLMLVVRDIQASRRAFPLMEIASRFVAQDDSYLLKLELPAPKEGEERKVFWQCRECKRVFCHKANAEAHVENAHLDLFFATEEQLAEPPAGAFNCVARCGFSGELLGPPNYHGYNARIQEIWSTRFAHVPKAEYLAKIEIVHDEGLLEEWKEQVRHQTVYRLRMPAEKKEEEAKPAETPAEEAKPEAPGAAEAAEAPEVPETAAEAAPEAPETPAAEAPAPAEEKPAETLGEPMDRKAAQEWIRANRMQRLLRESGRCMVPGLQSHKWDDITLRSAVDSARYREKQFPFTLSLALRPAFRHMRLHLFKVNARETYAGAVAPKAFDEATAAPQDREIVAFLREHPDATRVAVLEGLRPGAGAESPEGGDILLHLDGLITQGIVLALNNGTLFVPRAAPQAAEPAAEAPAEALAEGAAEGAPEAQKDAAEGAEAAEPAEEPAAEAVEEPAREPSAPQAEAAAEPVAEAEPTPETTAPQAEAPAAGPETEAAPAEETETEAPAEP